MDLTLRALKPEDVSPILDLLAETAVFRPEEIEVAREVLEAALKPGQSDYSVLVAELGGEAVGYAA